MGKEVSMGKEETIPEGDAEKGAKIFKQKCAQCHTLDKVSIRLGYLVDNRNNDWNIYACSRGVPDLGF